MTRGMTLIELLMVISVIGILAAISAPALLEYRRGLEVRQAATEIVELLNRAKLLARQTKRDAVFTVEPGTRTVSVHQGGSAVGSVTVSPEISCIQVDSGTGIHCNSGSLTVQAPYGTFPTNPAAIALKEGNQMRSVYIIGVTGKLVVR